MIEARRVLRFYAPFVDSSGARRMRGFGAARAAARFVAKQELDGAPSNDHQIRFGLILNLNKSPKGRSIKYPSNKLWHQLFDLVFGPKVEVLVEVSPGFTYSTWRRNVPNSAQDRAAMFAEKFPLERCPYGCYDCESYGYSRCSTRAWMQARVAAILKNEVTR